MTLLLVVQRAVLPPVTLLLVHYICRGDGHRLQSECAVRNGADAVNGSDQELFTIAGGSGRFAGAVGSGTFTDGVDFNKGAVTRTVDGVILVPG
jgi:hypothetical protein